jgi:AcrR family transcriptional regulator
MTAFMGRKKLYQPHYSTATDARILQKRGALREALLRLLADRPLEQISIREIAAAAGVGYNTFFRHHTSKEALLKEIVTEELSELIALSVTTLDASNSLEASRALCRFVAEHDSLWSTLLTGGAANTLRDEFIRLLRETAPSRISGTARLPADIGIKLVAVGTVELLAWWLAQEQRIPAEQVAEIYERLVATPVMDAYKR